jgi:hypothetical protein
MGRTVLPYSHVLEKEKESWKLFRKAMSKDDQEAFDRLFDRAKLHTHAAVYQSHSFPIETILLSIRLEHEKMIEEILRKLKPKPAETELQEISGMSDRRDPSDRKGTE